jgi:hypothetical protein
MLSDAERMAGVMAATRARALAHVVASPVAPKAGELVDLHIAATVALNFYRALTHEARGQQVSAQYRETIFRAALDMERALHRAAVLMAQHFTPEGK